MTAARKLSVEESLHRCQTASPDDGVRVRAAASCARFCAAREFGKLRIYPTLLSHFAPDARFLLFFFYVNRILRNDAMQRKYYYFYRIEDLYPNVYTAKCLEV